MLSYFSYNDLKYHLIQTYFQIGLSKIRINTSQVGIKSNLFPLADATANKESCQQHLLRKYRLIINIKSISAVIDRHIILLIVAVETAPPNLLMPLHLHFALKLLHLQQVSGPSTKQNTSSAFSMSKKI